MFDIFYLGKKPNVAPHEKCVESSDQARELCKTRYFWLITYLADFELWDWLWEPAPWQRHQRHAWPSQWQKDAGIYLIPKQGFQDTQYHQSPILLTYDSSQHWQNKDDQFDYTWHPDPVDTPYIYQFGTQWQKTGGPRYVVPGATEVKYVKSPRAVRSKVDDHWQLPENSEFEKFDYTWHPDDTDEPYIYQFGTQWQKTGGPRYVVPGATEVKYVEQIKIKTTRVANRVFLIDHLDGNVETVKNQLSLQFDVKIVRYFDNYLDTLKRISRSCKDDMGFVWICSSNCDYSNFDFSWHPEQWQSGMLHVFASDEQKFGDTFLMHPNTFFDRSSRVQLLEWFDTNFVTELSVPRWPVPVVRHNYDTHVEAVQSMDWKGPLAVFTTGPAPDQLPAVSLWRQQNKTVVPLSAGASSVIVPKVAVPHIKTQLYDYEFVDKSHVDSQSVQDQLLDIVFISNGEVNAEQNWKKLNSIVDQHNILNRVVRIDGVDGRVAAYQAAAAASQTPWFFAVFAKLDVDSLFPWHWQPDRMQLPKHYIFHAHNPITRLQYGHMAIVAYNKNLVLKNTATGLDFTLDQEHEVVPILSGTAQYHNSAWMCWRTAFRECIKLKHSLPDVENEYRLAQWLKENNSGEHTKWSHIGAQDAINYYNAVAGEFSELRKSYDWGWLANYAFDRHALTPDQ